MAFSPYTTASGFLLPSLHSAPPFFTKQLNPNTNAQFTAEWTRLILTYARHRRLFVLRVEDAEVPGSDWDELLRNERIDRRVRPEHLSHLLAAMVEGASAVYEPPQQTRSVILYWRRPEEWAEVLHQWATNTGQLSTIMTFYEIVEPSVPSALSDLPLALLRAAITILTKTARAQIIAIPDGEGVRFLEGKGA